MDGTLGIWDVILARQIDAVHVDVSVTALSLSPNMDVLATTHVEQNGVYLWVNQALFSAPSLYLRWKILYTRILTSEEVQNISQIPLPDQQSPDLVTLSLLPKSQWQSLINLDIIKARNKPIEPPKKPEKAPFFLPSIPSLSGEILFKPTEINEEQTDAQAGETEKSLGKVDIPTSQFLQFLKSSAEEKNFAAFTNYVKGLSSSTLDMELRMLQIVDDDENMEDEEPVKRSELYFIELLLDWFIQEISCRNNFEFVQALIRLFLKIHGESIRRQPVLLEKTKKLLEVQSAVWQKVDKLFQSTRCTVAFLSNSQL